ncbi:MAG: hypothetical protein ACTHL7_02830 [Steroidobacteraceae bacterium]
MRAANVRADFEQGLVARCAAARRSERLANWLAVIALLALAIV